MSLDEGKILEAIQGTQLPPSVLEEGARLVDHWVSECAELDARDETFGVEIPFYMEPEPLTFVVGTQDRVIKRYSDGKVCGCEWKTAKHETKFWNSDTWLESISNGHQIVTYAAGLKYGNFAGFVDLKLEPIEGDVEILVRAVSKSHPPAIWPSPEGQFISISEGRIQHTLSAYRNAAASIRAMRATSLLPWQVPGLQCTNMFRKLCLFSESCKKGEIKEGSWQDTSLSPGSQRVVGRLRELGKITKENEKDVVVLSASTLSTFQQCSERWRKESLISENEGEDSEAMDIGTVLHVGLSEFYSQMMREITRKLKAE